MECSQCNLTHLVFGDETDCALGVLGKHVEQWAFAFDVRQDHLQHLTWLDELDLGQASSESLVARAGRTSRTLTDLEHVGKDGRVNGETSASREELDSAV